jgi:ATP-dependent Clp protease adapter protein ClpS
MSIHEDILAAVAVYTEESAKFEDKGVKAAAARARGALGDLAKLAKARRAENQ